MTNSEFNDLLSRIQNLSPAQMRRLRDKVDAKLANSATSPGDASLGSLGAMREAADELDAAVDRAMKSRREPGTSSSGE